MVIAEVNAHHHTTSHCNTINLYCKMRARDPFSLLAFLLLRQLLVPARISQWPISLDIFFLVFFFFSLYYICAISFCSTSLPAWFGWSASLDSRISSNISLWLLILIFLWPEWLNTLKPENVNEWLNDWMNGQKSPIIIYYLSPHISLSLASIACLPLPWSNGEDIILYYYRSLYDQKRLQYLDKKKTKANYSLW